MEICCDVQTSRTETCLAKFCIHANHLTELCALHTEQNVRAERGDNYSCTDASTHDLIVNLGAESHICHFFREPIHGLKISLALGNRPSSVLVPSR